MTLIGLLRQLKSQLDVLDIYVEKYQTVERLFMEALRPEKTKAQLDRCNADVKTAETHVVDTMRAFILLTVAEVLEESNKSKH